MAYTNELRPRKKLLKAKFYGKFGKFDFRDGVEWGEMPMEALVAFAKLHQPSTVEKHLVGELPKKETAKAKAKKISEKPSTDDKQEEQ